MRIWNDYQNTNVRSLNKTFIVLTFVNGGVISNKNKIWFPCLSLFTLKIDCISYKSNKWIWIMCICCSKEAIYLSWWKSNHYWHRKLIIINSQHSTFDYCTPSIRSIGSKNLLRTYRHTLIHSKVLQVEFV